MSLLSSRFAPLAAFAVASVLFSCREKDSAPAASSSPVQPEASVEIRDEEALRAAAVSRYIESFSDEERVSQLFLVNIEGNSSFAPVENLPGGNALVPGGCLLFSFNIADSAEKVASFTSSIRSFYESNGSIPPYIAIDQEGGDVNRLRGLTSVLWSQMKVSQRFTVENARKLYAEQAKQMKMLGIDMNLAPVVEVDDGTNTEFLGTRTFGTLGSTLSYGRAEIGGYEDNGVATVLKHFPGNSGVDPHSGLPFIAVPRDSLGSFVRPFSELLPLSSAVLMSHAVVSAGDEGGMEKPACLSPFWCGYIRKELGFGGLILSDDIFMGALADNGFPPEVAAVEAVKAGVDVIMLSEKKFGFVALMLLGKMKDDGELSARISESVRRVVEFKIKIGALSFSENGGEFSVVPSPARAFDGDVFGAAKTAGMHLYD